MNTYIITYIAGESDLARAYKIVAESEGEAIEMFEDFAERFDDGYDFISIKEV